MVELWGLLEGFKLVLDLGVRRVEVNSDSSEIFMDITKGRFQRSEGLELLRKIGMR